MSVWRNLFLSFLFLCFFLSEGAAQVYRRIYHPDSLAMEKVYRRKTIFSFQPLSLFGFGLQAGYERKVSAVNSIKATAGYYAAAEPYFYDSFKVKAMEGFQLELQPRVYVQQAIHGLYLGGYVLYKYIHFNKQSTIYANGTTPEQYTTEASAWGGGFVIGVQQVLASRVVIDLNIGAGFIKPIAGDIETAHLNLVNPYKNTINPKLGVSIGFAF